MIDCIYTADGPPWKCTRCGHEQSVTQALRRNCRSKAPIDPRAYLESAVASGGLSNVTQAETARRIDCCVGCPSLVNQACLELSDASGECRAKAIRYHVRRLLGRWTPCERMTSN
jgi:hypothetical protein